MWVRAGFVIACVVLIAAVLVQRLGRPFKDHDVIVGASGFWVVTLGAALLANFIF